MKVILCGTLREADGWRAVDAGIEACTVPQVADGILNNFNVEEYAVTELAREQKGIYDAVNELHHKTRGVAR